MVDFVLLNTKFSKRSITLKVNKLKAESSRKVKIKTTKDNITSRSGLLLAEELLRSLDARTILDERLSVKKRKRGFSESEFITSCALAILDGSSCLSDMDRMRDDSETLELLDIDGMPHSTTIGEFIDKFTLGHIRQFESALRQISSGLHEVHPTPDVTVDMDSIVLEKYGSQQGVAMSYRRKKGYHPQFAFRADTGECVFARLQRGNAFSSRNACKMLKAIIKSLPGGVETTRFRADSAWYAVDFMELCESFHSMYYYVTAKQHGPLMSAIYNIPDTDWVSFNDYEQVAEIYYGIKGTPPRRFIAKRREEKPGDKQSVMDFVKYKYHVVVTNDQDKKPAECMRFATGRCNVENRLKEMVHGLSLNHLPGKYFISNWAYLLMVVLAYNLGVWMSFYAFPERHRRICFKTMRYRFLHVAGRLCKSGRQFWLALKENYLYLQDFIEALTRIRKIAL